MDSAELVTLLVSKGGHSDFRARDGLSAVHKAAVLGSHRALKMLLDLGASPDLRDAAGLTPLYHSAMGGSAIRCAEILLKDRAEIGITNRDAWTELHQAAKHGHEAHVEALALCVRLSAAPCRALSLRWQLRCRPRGTEQGRQHGAAHLRDVEHGVVRQGAAQPRCGARR